MDAGPLGKVYRERMGESVMPLQPQYVPEEGDLKIVHSGSERSYYFYEDGEWKHWPIEHPHAEIDQLYTRYKLVSLAQGGNIRYRRPK